MAVANPPLPRETQDTHSSTVNGDLSRLEDAYGFMELSVEQLDKHAKCRGVSRDYKLPTMFSEHRVKYLRRDLACESAVPQKSEAPQIEALRSCETGKQVDLHRLLGEEFGRGRREGARAQSAQQLGYRKVMRAVEAVGAEVLEA
jgi:hypothetical protein